MYFYYLFIAVLLCLLFAAAFLFSEIVAVLINMVHPQPPTESSLAVLVTVIVLLRVALVLDACRSYRCRETWNAESSAAVRRILHVPGEPPEAYHPVSPAGPVARKLIYRLSVRIASGLTRRRARSHALWRLGSNIAAAFLALLAERPRPVPIRELARSWDSRDDIASIIIRVSAIRGVFLTPSQDPYALSLMPKLRVRLMKAGRLR